METASCTVWQQERAWGPPWRGQPEGRTTRRHTHLHPCTREHTHTYTSHTRINTQTHRKAHRRHKHTQEHTHIWPRGQRDGEGGAPCPAAACCPREGLWKSNRAWGSHPPTRLACGPPSGDHTRKGIREMQWSLGLWHVSKPSGWVNRRWLLCEWTRAACITGALGPAGSGRACTLGRVDGALFRSGLEAPWRVQDIHWHLSPENGGNHHIYTRRWLWASRAMVPMSQHTALHKPCPFSMNRHLAPNLLSQLCSLFLPPPQAQALEAICSHTLAK